MDIKVEPDDDSYDDLSMRHLKTHFINVALEDSIVDGSYSQRNNIQRSATRDVDVSEKNCNADNVTVKEEAMEIKTELDDPEWSRYKVSFYDDLVYSKSADFGECSYVEGRENLEETTKEVFSQTAIKREIFETNQYQNTSVNSPPPAILMPKIEFNDSTQNNLIFSLDDTELSYNDLTFMGKSIKQIILDSERNACIKLSRIKFYVKNFVCDVCCSNFKSKNLLKTHKISCGHFKFDRNKMGKYNKMVISQDSGVKNNLFVIKKDIKLFECDVCPYKCKANNSLTRHKIIHSSEKPFKCEFCSAEFRQSCHLKSHQLIHTNINPFACDECSLTFRNSSNLKRHKMCHKNERPYKCEKCPSIFRQMCHLRAHEMIHDEVFPLTCDVCQLKFRKLGNLKRHKMQHESLTRLATLYECNECDSTFKQYVQLKMHKLMSHSNEKPLVKCAICDLVFTTEGNLNRHKILTHEKPFECDICHSKFSSSIRLANHKANNCKPKMFECDQCSSKFTRIGHLNLHKAIHSTETPLHCDLCTYRCRKKRDLKTHKSTHFRADSIAKVEHIVII